MVERSITRDCKSLALWATQVRILLPAPSRRSAADTRRHRLARSRTLPSHGSNTSSNLVGATRMKTNYEELFPEEFEARVRENPVAFLPLGSLEYHGYHNVLGLDALKAWKICQLASEKAGGIVFPPLYLGLDAYSDIDLEKYPNKRYDCYHLDESILQKVLESYFHRMIRIGFKKIFVLAGHYPNRDVAELAAEKYKDEAQFVIVKEPDLVDGESGDHAGKWETSLMMVLFPELVDLSKGKDEKDRLMAVEGEDPETSSAEYGKKILDKMILKMESLLTNNQ